MFRGDVVDQRVDELRTVGAQLPRFALSRIRPDQYDSFSFGN